MASHAYARIERERRFLLDRLPPPLLPDSPHALCTDLYLPDLRLRLRSLVPNDSTPAAYKLGQKHRPAGFAPHEREMTTLYLTAGEHARLAVLLGTGIPPLIKRRYPFEYEGLRYAIDVFEGPHAGLILADLELRDADRLQAAPVPPFAIREVTADPAFEGGTLAAALRG